MVGKSIAAFMQSLYDNPEIEFVFREKQYIISGWIETADTIYTLELWNISLNRLEFRFSDKRREQCVSQFEKAKIFDGLTIYEAESEIEVLYG